MLRAGLNPWRGFTSETYEEEHWDGSGQPTRHCDIDDDYILSPEDVLPVENLNRQVPQVPWDRLQGSGVRVRAEAEDRLHKLWAG